MLIKFVENFTLHVFVFFINNRMVIDPAEDKLIIEQTKEVYQPTDVISEPVCLATCFTARVPTGTPVCTARDKGRSRLAHNTNHRWGMGGGG